MKKPWEETWNAWLGKGSPTGAAKANRCGGAILEMGDHSYALWDDDAERALSRARLAAAAPEMARLLLALEWAGMCGPTYDAVPACPSCSKPQWAGARGGEHAPDCALVAVLRKAGIIA